LPRMCTGSRIGSTYLLFVTVSGNTCNDTNGVGGMTTQFLKTNASIVTGNSGKNVVAALSPISTTPRTSALSKRNRTSAPFSTASTLLVHLLPEHAARSGDHCRQRRIDTHSAGRGPATPLAKMRTPVMHASDGPRRREHRSRSSRCAI